MPVAHASDGGGSIRVPSATTGLVGMKVSRGPHTVNPAGQRKLVSASLVDHAVTRSSARQRRCLLDLTHGPDQLAPYEARPPRMGTFAEAAARDPGRLTIGVYRDSTLGLEVSAETGTALDRAIDLAREAGHMIEEIDLPMIDRAFMADFCRVVAASISGLLRVQAARNGRACYPISNDRHGSSRGSATIIPAGELLRNA